MGNPKHPAQYFGEFVSISFCYIALDNTAIYYYSTYRIQYTNWKELALQKNK